MKQINKIITNSFCTFSVLSLLFGILCRMDILIDLSYTKVVFPLFFMALLTSIFVAGREFFISEPVKWKYIIDIIGCTIIILFIGQLVGWLEVSMSYFSLIIVMVLLVYVAVWGITWIQSKHDEDDLNRLLQKQGKGKK